MEYYKKILKIDGIGSEKYHKAITFEWNDIRDKCDQGAQGREGLSIGSLVMIREGLTPTT